MEDLKGAAMAPRVCHAEWALMASVSVHQLDRLAEDRRAAGAGLRWLKRTRGGEFEQRVAPGPQLSVTKPICLLLALRLP